MNISEFYDFATWLSDEIEDITPLYRNVAQVLQHNSTQPEKQPVEESLVLLTENLKKIDLTILSNEQLRLLDAFDVKELIGIEGVNFVESKIKKSDFDPATAHSEFNEAIQRLASANKRSKAINTAFGEIKDLVEEPALSEGRVLIRVEFRKDASIDDVAEWKTWSATWHDIVRGVGMAVGEAPEDTRVVGASQGSIIIVLAATYTFTHILALISKSVASIAKDYLEILHSIEDLKSKKLLNNAAENELQNNANEIKDKGVERILSDVDNSLQDKLPGDKRNALEKSIEKALDFYNKGGDVDFVAPPESEIEDEEDDETQDDATRNLIKEIRVAIEDTRRIRDSVKLLSDQRDKPNETE